MQSFDICDQAITVEIQFQSMNFSCHASGCTKQERRSLWDNLLNISSSLTGPWILGGVFSLTSKSTPSQEARASTLSCLQLSKVSFSLIKQGSEATRRVMAKRAFLHLRSVIPQRAPSSYSRPSRHTTDSGHLSLFDPIAFRAYSPSTAVTRTAVIAKSARHLLL